MAHGTWNFLCGQFPDRWQGKMRLTVLAYLRPGRQMQPEDVTNILQLRAASIIRHSCLDSTFHRRLHLDGGVTFHLSKHFRQAVSGAAFIYRLSFNLIHSPGRDSRSGWCHMKYDVKQAVSFWMHGMRKASTR